MLRDTTKLGTMDFTTAAEVVGAPKQVNTSQYTQTQETHTHTHTNKQMTAHPLVSPGLLGSGPDEHGQLLGRRVCGRAGLPLPYIHAHLIHPSKNTPDS